MKNMSKMILLPLIALVITGCTLSPAKKKKSSREIPTTDVPTSSDPTSEDPTTTSSTPSSEPGSSTPSTTSATPTTSAVTPSSSVIPASSSVAPTSSSSEPPVPEPPTKTKLAYTYDDYQANNLYGLDNCPLVGSPKLLIIPVWFKDSDEYIRSDAAKETVRNDIQTAYTGSNEETGWRSVKTYYQEESQNILTLQAKVTDWYEVNQNAEYYSDDPSSATTYVPKTQSLVKTAVSWYFGNNLSDSRQNYDTNGDGFMDGVMLIYAAPDYRTYQIGSGSNLWAYCYWTNSNASTSNPVAKSFFWASYDFMYDGDTAYDRLGSPYGNGDCEHCNIDAHTFIHEMGHVLGLNDYYDYGDTGLWAAGAFSMQDWNRGGHDPYSVMAYGWADPYIPTETTTLTINDFQSSHDVILLANHTGVNSPFDEYILVELYTPTGLNAMDATYPYDGHYQGPDDVGIRIWHIDARLTYISGYSHGEYTWSTSLTTNPYHVGFYPGVYHAFDNSYGDGYSVLGSEYTNYNILQFIRNDTSVTTRPAYEMRNSDLFKTGEVFSMSKFSGQFVKGQKMNDGNDFGWTITVNSLTDTQASITCTKL